MAEYEKGISLNRVEMEKRRLEAADALGTGTIQAAVARKFGVSRTTASRWNRALQEKGVNSLLRRKAPGRPSRLSREQLQIIPDIFAQGALVNGFFDNRWTVVRMAAVIEARFGVNYNPDHVGRIMQKLNIRPLMARRDVPYASPAVLSGSLEVRPAV